MLGDAERLAGRGVVGGDGGGDVVGLQVVAELRDDHPLVRLAVLPDVVDGGLELRNYCASWCGSRARVL